jgi:hypothetical protein
LTSLSSGSSSDRSEAPRYWQSKPLVYDRSQLSSTPLTYDEPDDHFASTGFNKINEESLSSGRSRDQSYDSTPDCSGTPKLGVSDSSSLEPQSVSGSSVISYQPSLATSIDENSNNSKMRPENLKEQPLQNLSSNSSSTMVFQGKFSCEDILAL